MPAASQSTQQHLQKLFIYAMTVFIIISEDVPKEVPKEMP
jgi:hypothetical protein